MTYIDDKIRVSIERFGYEFHPNKFLQLFERLFAKRKQVDYFMYHYCFEEKDKLTSISTLEHFGAFIRDIRVVF